MRLWRNAKSMRRILVKSPRVREPAAGSWPLVWVVDACAQVEDFTGVEFCASIPYGRLVLVMICFHTQLSQKSKPSLTSSNACQQTP